MGSDEIEIGLANEQIYALVDPFFGEPPGFECSSDQAASFAELSKCRAQAWGRPVWVAAGQRPLIEPHRLPFIVQLEAGDPLLEDLLQQSVAEHAANLDGASSRAYRLGSFIESGMPPELIMQRLERMWSYSHQSLGPRYLRLGDWRVMELLIHLVRPQIISQWLGPFVAWYCLGRSFEWHIVRGVVGGAVLSETDQFRRLRVFEEAAIQGANLRLDDAEHALLLHSESVSLALTHLQQVGVVPEAALFSRLPIACRQAEAYRFRSPQDEASFIANVLVASPGASNERMEKALANYPKSKESLETLLELTGENTEPKVCAPNMRTIKS